MSRSAERCPGSPGHALCKRAVVGRRHVGPTCSHDVGGHERLNQIRQPGRIDADISVDIGDDVPKRGVQSHVSRGCQSAIRDLDQPGERMSADALRRRVRRSIVHDNHFEPWVVDVLECIEAVVNRRGRVVRAHDDGHRRPMTTHLGGIGRVAEHL
jgi:hypothetical protein